MRATWMLLGLVACDPNTTPPPSGTSVGNPGKNVFRLAPTPGLDVDVAEAGELSFELVSCDGTAEAPPTETTIDLVTSEPVSFSGFEWCAVVFTAGELRVSGAATDGEPRPFDLTLAPPFPLTLWTGAPIAVDGESFVLELGTPGWITAEDLGVEGLTVSPESELHDLLLLPLLDGTAWYLDDDDDGELVAAERDAGPVAAATFAPPPEMSEDTDEPPGSVGVDGCNCATSGPPLPVVLGAALLVARRRRRA